MSDSESDSESPKQSASSSSTSNALSAPGGAPRIKGIYQILPYVYMSDADAACNKDELKYLGITTILNCASEDVDNMFPEDFKYVEFPIEDVHDAEPNKHFEEAFESLSAVKENKEFALVHCTTGKNISPTIILAYMMMSSHKQDKHLPLAKAIQYVQNKAPGATPSPQFLSQLIDLEVELFEDASVKVPGRRGTAGRQGYTRGKGKRGK